MQLFHFVSGSCFIEKPERPSAERFSVDIRKQFCVCFGSSLSIKLCDWLKNLVQRSLTNQNKRTVFQPIRSETKTTLGLPQTLFSRAWRRVHDFLIQVLIGVSSVLFSFAVFSQIWYLVRAWQVSHTGPFYQLGYSFFFIFQYPTPSR